MRTRVGPLTVAALIGLSACTSSNSGVVGKGTSTTIAEAPATSAPSSPTTQPDQPPASEVPPSTSPGPLTLPDGLDGAAEIADDPGVRIERLDNGLTVYIRSNDNPGRQVQLRLVVDAGSVLQDDDQSAVAHFLEHMLFNGTAKYPANDLINVLQGFGMEFGADVNAYTSFDETVYELTVPTDDDKNLPTGIDVLAEWLSAATLDPQQVVDERGVVLDEWRGDATFQGRVFDTIERLFLAGTAYDAKDPIGTDSAIQAMTPELLRRFYDRWYRPDNAAVVVVGDVDADEVFDLVKERFGGLTARGESPARPEITVAPMQTPAAGRHVDPDAVDSFVELTLAEPAVADRTIGGYVEGTLQSIAFDAIATRLSDDISRGKLPFSSASTDSNSHTRALDAPSVVVNARAEDSAAALQTLLDEFGRAQRFGFGAGEIARIVAQYRAGVESAHDSANSTQDVDFAATYVGHFLSGSTIPSSDDEYELAVKVLDWVTPEAVAGAFGRRWAASAPRLLIVGPESADAQIPTEDAALAAIAALADRPLEARPDEVFDATSLMAAPEAVDETSSEELTQEPGAYIEPTMLTFANGAKVVINPNQIVEQGVAFAAASPGGLSLVDDARIATATLMPEVMINSGIGGLDAVQAQAVLADASVDFQPYLDQTTENLAGGASTPDLETLFQLINLSFTGARFDQAAFDTAVDSWRPYAENPNTDPGLAAAAALAAARYGSLPRFAAVPTPAELDAVTLDGMRALWAERYAGANDWVFVFTGDLDVETVTDLARRYIGSLPGTNATEQWVDLQPEPPPGIVVADVNSGTGEQAGIQQLYTALSDGSIREQVLADLLSTIVTSRLTDHVREQLGASYSPNAAVGISTEPDPIVETFVDVTGSPEGIEQLSDVVRADIADLAANGPTDADLEEASAELAQNYDLFNNGDLSSVLLDAATDGDAIGEYLSRQSILRDLRRDDVAAFAARALPVGQLIEIRIRPA